MTNSMKTEETMQKDTYYGKEKEPKKDKEHQKDEKDKEKLSGKTPKDGSKIWDLLIHCYSW